MPNFAANLVFLFNEHPFLERFEAAHRAGFDAVECMFHDEYNLDDIKALLKKNELRLILCNLPAGNWPAGDRGMASDPGRRREFRAGVARGLHAALTLGIPRMNCLVGLKNEALTGRETWKNVQDNIWYAAEALGKEGIKLMVEPVNHFDMPGFALNTCTQVLTMLEQIGHPNAYLQFDVYHTRRENEDPAEILHNHFDRIGHIQIADSPGRHQPGTGETDFRYLLPEIDRMGYQGFVSLEYIPVPDTLTSLEWLPAYGYPLNKKRSGEK
jgi:hydroxypyruvate isomerase